jgi:hypothetical protein
MIAEKTSVSSIAIFTKSHMRQVIALIIYDFFYLSFARWFSLFVGWVDLFSWGAFVCCMLSFAFNGLICVFLLAYFALFLLRQLVSESY